MSIIIHREVRNDPTHGVHIDTNSKKPNVILLRRLVSGRVQVVGMFWRNQISPEILEKDLAEHPMTESYASYPVDVFESTVLATTPHHSTSRYTTHLANGGPEVSRA